MVARRRDRVQVLLFAHRLSLTGGVPVFTRTLLTCLAREGVTTCTCTIREALQEDMLESLPGTNTHRHLSMPKGRPARLWDHGLIVLRLSRHIRAERPEVIHANDSLAAYVGIGGPIARLLGAPRYRLVIQAHEPFSSGMLGRRRQQVLRAMCRWGSAQIVADVESIARQLEFDLRVPAGRVLALPLAVDTDAFDRLDRRGSLRAQLGIPPEGLIIAYIARPAQVKNHDAFFEVAKRIVDHHQNVWFVTTHPDAERSGPRVRAIPSLPAPQDLLFDADVYLSTSLYEGFGLSIVEAMASGLPVIAFAGGSVAEVVGDAGIVVPLGHLRDLEAAVVRVLEDESLRQELGRRARKRARSEFGFEAFSSRYTALLAPRSKGREPPR